MRGAVGGHLPFLHRFEQRGLGLRWCAVDLVAEEQVGEQRPGTKLEVAGALVEDRRPGDVGRHEIGGELHAREAQADHLRERTGHERLGEAGVVVDQHVAVGEQPEQHDPQRVALPDDRALDLVEDGVGAGAGLGDREDHSCSSARTSASLASASRPGISRVSSVAERGVEHERERVGHRPGQMRVDRVGLDLGVGAVAQPVGRDRGDERCEVAPGVGERSLRRRRAPRDADEIERQWLRRRRARSATRSSGDGGASGAARRSAPAAVTTVMRPTSAVSSCTIRRLSLGSTASATPVAVRLRIVAISARRSEIRRRRLGDAARTLNRSDRAPRRSRDASRAATRRRDRRRAHRPRRR